MRRIAVCLMVGLVFLGAGMVAGLSSTQAQERIILAQVQDPIGNFFRNLFGGFQRQPQRTAPHHQQRRYAPAPQRQRQQPARRDDSSRSSQQAAPQPRAVQKDADARRVVVFGDFFAAGLKDGLEQAFAESSNIVVDGSSEPNSGLVRRDQVNWPSLIEERLETSDAKMDIAVVMIGGNDLQPLHAGAEQYLPRTEAWRELYSARIDEILDLFYGHGVPVYWVGLPPAQSEQLNQHYAFFNELYRERAYRAGADFIDIWNSFVDENGNYAASGPDLNGEIRQLRADDGLHFTESGNRKLAHFVSREIRRDIGQDGDLLVSLPRGPVGPQPYVGTESQARTGIGDVVTLTGGTAGSRALAGGPLPSPEPPSDSAYFRAVVQGEAIEPRPGSSADFTWPRESGAGDVAEEQRSADG